MAELFVNRITLLWLVLVGATVLSFEVGHGIGFDDIRHAGIAILVISFVKVRFVILDFMEVRHTPPVMRIIAEAWVILLCALLIALYMAGTN